MEFGLTDTISLSFVAKVKDDKKGYADKTYIRTSYVYPFYEADYYRKNGDKLTWTAYTAEYAYYDATGSTP